jgi:hypothetical protein
MGVPRPRVRQLASALLVVAAICLPSAVAAQPAVQAPELLFIAPPELEAAAAGLGRLDTSTLVTVMRLLGMTEAGPPIRVMVAPEDAPVARSTPSWVAGFADGKAGHIVIFPSRTPSYPYDSQETLLNHEVTHVLVSRAAPYAEIPRWFHEGLAMALEGGWSVRDRSQVAMAIVSGRRSLAAVEADFQGSATQAARAYGVAGAFMRDLIGRHGPQFPARVIAALNAGARFEDAFSVATFTSLNEAERLFWQDSWWYRVVPVLTSSIVLWMLIVLLAMSARRRRAEQRRFLHERWREEERASPAAPNPQSLVPKSQIPNPQSLVPEEE